VSSAYLRGDLEFFERRLKLVGGIRAEQTNIKAEGPLTDLSRNVRRDPQGRPLLDASGRPQLIAAPNTLEFSQLTFINRGYRAEKEYLSWFPSINASYNVRENLIARLAYSTSIGRPSYQQYAGGINLPDPDNPSPNDRITVSNVALKPWSAHAVHARLEYYFEGVGQVSVAAFRRDFEDFFGGTTFDVTPEFLALYNLDPAVYGNYDVQTQHNIQSAVRMQGLSVSYKQALTFLPAWARGVQVFANGSAQRLLGSGTSNFIGFIPRTASWGASLSRPRYTLRANWNYRGRQRRNAVAVGNSIEPGTFNWFSKRLYLDLSGEYRFAKHYALYASMRNAGDATEDTEIHGPNTPAHAHLRTRQQFGSVWTIGIKGTF
ncbi:MAG: TonB-dependent receptor domain-containing protein, partial [Gammaproteobacteria bacterium]